MGKYKQLSMSERRRLSVFLEMGISIGEISKRLDRNKATVYREIRRNKGTEVYCAGAAQRKADGRRERSHCSKLQKDGILRDYVVRSLQKGWSPEQISGRMKYQKLHFYACPETIYLTQPRHAEGGIFISNSAVILSERNVQAPM
ncbi:MAG TPA: hypothetical protein DIC51_01560 [Coxiellaceae bacterium]|nr:hypothetical protein [Coxiellaceae bacterium]